MANGSGDYTVLSLVPLLRELVKVASGTKGLHKTFARLTQPDATQRSLKGEADVLEILVVRLSGPKVGWRPSQGSTHPITSQETTFRLRLHQWLGNLSLSKPHTNDYQAISFQDFSCRVDTCSTISLSRATSLLPMHL